MPCCLQPPCAVQEITHEGGEECCAFVEVVLGLGLASQLQEDPPWTEFLQIPDGQDVVFAEIVSHNDHTHSIMYCMLQIRLQGLSIM